MEECVGWQSVFQCSGHHFDDLVKQFFYRDANQKLLTKQSPL